MNKAFCYNRCMEMHKETEIGVHRAGFTLTGTRESD
jgi:hypothetical protein